MPVKALSEYVVSPMYPTTLAPYAFPGLPPITYSLTIIGELWSGIAQGILSCRLMQTDK